MNTALSYYVILGLGLVVSLIFCIKRRKGFSIQNLMLKSISSLCYLLTAVFALIINTDAQEYGTLVIFGGALGLVGDINLDLKGLYKKDEKSYLNAGFMFFLVGHIFYITAIIFSYPMKWWVMGICLLASIGISIGNLCTAKFTKVHFGAYRNIVTAYVIFLSMTMTLAIAACILSGFEKKYVLLAVGSISFTLSDVVLSSTFFGRGKDTSFYYFINHFLYYAGQYLIASTILFM